MPADIVTTGIHGLAGRSGALDAVMRFVAADLLFAVVLVLLALWFHDAGLRAGLAAGIGAIIAVACGAVVGAIWPETRPFAADHFAPLIPHAADASFPSDHLLALGAVTGAIWFGARRLALASLAIAVVVGFARLFVGVHYLVDVGGGFAIGFASGALAWLALRPAVPLLGRLDAELRRRGLRPILGGPR